MRSTKTPLVLALLLIGLAGAAVLVVTAHSRTPATSHEHAVALQRLVGGLGCGPAVDLSRCAFSFDPRLCQDCPLRHAPVPGGIYFCPQHACSILYCRPLTTAEEGDGRAP